MNHLKNAKIGKKLTIAFSIISAVLVVVIVMSIASLGFVSQNIVKFYNKPYTNNMAQMEMRKNVQMVGKNVLWSIISDDETEVKERVDEAKTCIARVGEIIALLTTNFPNKDLVQELKDNMAVLAPARDNILDLVLENKKDEAYEIFRNDYAPAAEDVQNTLIKISDYAEEIATDTYESTLTTRDIMFIVLILFSIFSIAICFILQRTLSKLMTVPISELEMASNKLKKGELDISIEYTSKDELGALSEGFAHTCEYLKSIIEDMKFETKR